jgi:hypothetical protein
MAAKVMCRLGSTWNVKFGEVLAGSVIVLAALEILTGVIGGAWLIADEKVACGGEGELYALRCTTSNPYVLLGAAVIVGALAQGFLLLMAGMYIRKRGDVVRAGESSEVTDG